MRNLFLLICLICLCLLVMAAWNTMSRPTTASITLVVPHVNRINQLDCHQYASQQECVTWSPSSCSATAMASAMNAFGHDYRVTDVLQVEAAFTNPKVITPSDGLLYTGGLDRTLRTFGFQARQLKHPTIAQIEQEARLAPVIVNFPPDLWAGGHFLIVTGGDKQRVLLADSSSYNMRSLPVATFRSYWAGFAVVVTPLQQGGRS